MFPSLHISSSVIHDRAIGRLPPEMESSLVARPSAMRSPSAAISAPRAHDVRNDVRRDARATITSVSLSAAMAAAPAIRPHGFSTGFPFASPSMSVAIGLPNPLFQYPGIYGHQAAAAAAAATAAASAMSGSPPGSSGSSGGDFPILKPLCLPGGLSHFQALNHAQLASEMSKLKTPFINRNYLELAMLVCNTFRGKLFPCPHCRYVTDRRNNLKRHVSTMHQACDKVLECCGVQFNTKASLREHIMIFHHNGYSCPYCGRRFCRKALLKRHLSVHSGQKDYRCPRCDYATSHKSNLERHKRIHERLRLFDEVTGKPQYVDGDDDNDDEIEVGSESSEMMVEVGLLAHGQGGQQRSPNWGILGSREADNTGRLEHSSNRDRSHHSNNNAAPYSRIQQVNGSRKVRSVVPEDVGEGDDDDDDDDDGGDIELEDDYDVNDSNTDDENIIHNNATDVCIDRYQAQPSSMAEQQTLPHLASKVADVNGNDEERDIVVDSDNSDDNVDVN